jgi:hypothetical protein
MKKKFLRAVLLVIILTLMATSVVMAVKHEPTGDRIVLNEPPESFPAGEPFYVQHGFVSWWEITERVGNAVGLSEMTLTVDGIEVSSDYKEISWTNFKPDYPYINATVLFTFNFPVGLPEGDHTFVRRYFFTCQSYWDMGIPVECKNPAVLVEADWMMQSVTVSFD